VSIQFFVDCFPTGLSEHVCPMCVCVDILAKADMTRYGSEFRISCVGSKLGNKGLPIGINSIIRGLHYLDTLWYCFCIRSVYDVKSHISSTSAGLVSNAC
jgi:hypothetical protein